MAEISITPHHSNPERVVVTATSSIDPNLTTAVEWPADDVDSLTAVDLQDDWSIGVGLQQGQTTLASTKISRSHTSG